MAFYTEIRCGKIKEVAALMVARAWRNRPVRSDESVCEEIKAYAGAGRRAAAVGNAAASSNAVQACAKMRKYGSWRKTIQSIWRNRYGRLSVM